jgi:tRNA (guanine37-N1)-methyltransferase
VWDATDKRELLGGTAIVLLSASGKRFNQETARRFAGLTRIILICGRYEGVDERVAEHLATDEISIGDFVLSGGELPALLIVDAITRLLPGSLGNEASSQNESFSASVVEENISVAVGEPEGGVQMLLDFPHYTRPAEYRGWKVPDVLMGGNHAEVAAWRRSAAVKKTQRNRPDLIPGQEA